MTEKRISTKHGIMHNAVVFGIGRVVFLSTFTADERGAANSYGDRTFAAARPRLWNSLPSVQLRNPEITYTD